MKDLKPVGGQTATVCTETDVRLAVVHRVANSPELRESNRLRELFLFLCERALSEPGVVIHEQEVGIKVFGRSPDYDTSEDTLVRVHASRLRKKIQQYFLTGGQHEPIVIEIPKGGYTPVFQFRESPFSEIGPAPFEEPSHRPNRLKALVGLLAVCGIALIVFLSFTRANSNTRMRASPEPRPTVDRLWQQIFVNGRQTCLVLSDSTLTMLQDLLHRQIDLNEYKKREIAELADQSSTSPEQRVIIKSLMSKFFTHIADANVAWKIGMLNAVYQVPTDVVFARDFAVSYLQSHNVILLGSRRANPWLELFENQLNFRSGFQEQPPVSYFENHAPLPGESAIYRGTSWEKEGYCRVAFLPNLTRRGNILVISGTNMASTEAGGEFVTSERWMQQLASTMNLSKQARFPYFEVLLKVELLQADAPKFDIVAHRISR
jgi:hypothetical protein